MTLYGIIILRLASKKRVTKYVKLKEAQLKRKKTIRRMPKYSAQLALSLRDIELGLKRANKWLSLLSDIEHELRTEKKLVSMDEARRLEMVREQQEMFPIPDEIEIEGGENERADQ